MTAIRMQHDVDPAEAIWADMKEIVPHIRVGGHDVLIGMYERGASDKTKGGIILVDKTRDEDKYQGKSGMILKVGPFAFKPDTKSAGWFGSYIPKVGDWVAINIADTVSMAFGKRTCRLLEAQYVRMIIDSPDVIW